MSSDGENASPSLLDSLRQYRYQKKPAYELETGNEMWLEKSSSSPVRCRMAMKSHRILSESEDEKDSDIIVIQSDDSCDGSIKQGNSGAENSELIESDESNSGANTAQIQEETKSYQNNLEWNTEESHTNGVSGINYLAESSEVIFGIEDNGTAEMSCPEESSEVILGIEDNGAAAMSCPEDSSEVILGIDTARTQISDGSSFKRKADSEHTNNRKKVKKRRRYQVESDEDSNEKVFDSDDSDLEVSNVMTTTQNKVFQFVSSASEGELRQIPSCTQKKISTIIQLRPFTCWRDLVNRLESCRSVGASILNSVQDLVRARDVISALMNKCQRLSNRTERAIEDRAAMITRQPSLLSANFELKDYQMVGLNWLAIMHCQGLSGILADEMGLGKTIQVIAFLAYLKESGQTVPNSPHLIVVPSSTLENWANEFDLWCPDLRVVHYYGSPDERRMLRADWFKEKWTSMDVILTTYSIITSSFEDKKMSRVAPIHYVIYDEAHMLKNMNTMRYENLLRINAEQRILLTGTPLQNSLLELMSLLFFIKPSMFAGKLDYIKFLFSKNTKLNTEEAPPFEKEQVAKAKGIMKPFVLRRLKQDVLSDLPTKTSRILYCPMGHGQAYKYNQLVEEFKINRSENDSMSMVMQLRRIANHPLNCRDLFQNDMIEDMAALLAADPEYKDTIVSNIAEDLSFMSDSELHQLTENFKCLRKFALDESVFLTSGKFAMLDVLLKDLKESGHRVLIFSQFVFMLDIIQRYMVIRNHSFLRLDGSTPVSERGDLIDLYNSDGSIFIFLLTTKAGGLGINLTAADTVIIHDIDFNPYNDKQAEDRCHRVGQTRPVQIIRLLCKDTIEEAILAIATEKLHLEKKVTSTNDTDDGEVEEECLKSLLEQTLGIEENTAS